MACGAPTSSQQKKSNVLAAGYASRPLLFLIAGGVCGEHTPKWKDHH